jgi:predicted small lipoprotein YifL
LTVSRSPSVRRVVALSLVFALALVAAGCGRRGALEPPAGAIATPTPAPSASSDITDQMGRPKNPPITPPKQSFVLDPIL